MRKLGARVPKFLERRLRRLFPEVRLWWNQRKQVWVLVQVDPWPPMAIHALDGEPTLENTVEYLERASRLWNAPRREQRAFAEAIDDSHRDFALRQAMRGMEKRREGHKMLREKLTGKIVVPVGQELWRPH